MRANDSTTRRLGLGEDVQHATSCNHRRPGRAFGLLALRLLEDTHVTAEDQ
jgi:hypothetical protein